MITGILNLLINIGYVMFLAIKDAYVKLRLKYYNWKLAKLKSRVEARKKALIVAPTRKVT